MWDSSSNHIKNGHLKQDGCDNEAVPLEIPQNTCSCFAFPATAQADVNLFQQTCQVLDTTYLTIILQRISWLCLTLTPSIDWLPILTSVGTFVYLQGTFLNLEDPERMPLYKLVEAIKWSRLQDLQDNKTMPMTNSRTLKMNLRKVSCYLFQAWRCERNTKKNANIVQCNMEVSHYLHFFFCQKSNVES